MIEEIQKALKDRRIDLVAAATGLSRGTVTGIRDGTNINPTLDTLERLWDYLKETSVNENR